ncbi:MAG: hypothetical protein E7671_04645 [Ruminococcaceae bacterium]|nr:hypothetical protein [Oscillospiraceae bacterium]
MALLVKLKNLLIGSARITTAKENSALLLNVCMQKHLPYYETEFSEEKISIYTSMSSAKRLTNALKNEGIEYESKEWGLPLILSKYKTRWGLIAGAAIITVLLILSSNHVWDIRVSGNTSLTAAEVKAELANVGFTIGSRIGKRDVDEISNFLLIDSEKIAWISINFRGTVAYVTIREKESVLGERGEDIGTPANVVANRDGIIEYLEVMRGTPVVGERESVREGDLLISGIAENKQGEYRTERAIGKVYAVTNHSFSVKIPLEYDKKELSEPVCVKKTLKFFSNKINIFRKGGNLGASCVTIEEENSFSLPGLPALPVSVVSIIALEYKTVSARRTEGEASDLAFFELEKLISAELRDASLLRKEIRTEMTDTCFILECDVVCSENIAKTVPLG